MEPHSVAWMLSGMSSFAAFIISIKLIRGHLKNFTNPIVQSKIVGILWMVPIYSFDSWLSLRFKDSSVYLDMLRDTYEAYVIYLFLALLIAYLGDGEDEPVVVKLETLPPLQHPYPFRWCISPIQMGRGFLTSCKFATMQYVVLKPLTTLIALIMEVKGGYCEGQFDPACGYPYLSFVVNLSTTYAFYWLVLFFVALRHELAPFNPIPKFICIKAVLFLSFWQSVVIAGLSTVHFIHQIGSWSAEDVATGLQNFLICFEMLMVAVGHRYAFPYTPFVAEETDDSLGSLRQGLLSDNFASRDVIRDFNEVMPVLIPSSFAPGAATIFSKSPMEPQRAGGMNFFGEGTMVIGPSDEAIQAKNDDGSEGTDDGGGDGGMYSYDGSDTEDDDGKGWIL